MAKKAKTKIRKVSASDAIPTVVWGRGKGRHPFHSPYFPFCLNAEPGPRLSTDAIQLTLTLKVTTVQVVETLVTVNNTSPIQDYVHLLADDHAQAT